MKNKILAFGICILMLLVVFSSGCVETEKGKEGEGGTTEEQGQGETEEKPKYYCYISVLAYNIGDVEKSVWFYMNDEYEMMFDIEPNDYANGAAEKFQEPCNVKISIYVGADEYSPPPWVDDTQGDWYIGYIPVSTEDASKGGWKQANFYFDENNGGLAETSIDFEIENKETYQSYFVDLYIDDIFIDSEYLGADEMMYRLVPNVGVGRHKVSIYANGDWGERYVDVTSEWWTEGTTDASYVFVEIDVSASGVVVY
ncbi:MAG: hypothetical protein KKA79_10250 [Nanoarchaeota archaeon]|nr:hypothetical protein [Nanoarchaeota archaeon]